MRITSVDPWCADVVSVRTCDLDKCVNPISTVENSGSDDTAWSLSGKDYFEKSGRNIVQNRKRKRRSVSYYREALSRFDHVKKTSSEINTFKSYCRVVSGTFKAMYSEKNKSARKRTRLNSSRMVQKTVDRLANRISVSGSRNDNMPKNIVLFGGSTFSHQQGHASAPRQKIIRALAPLCCVRIMDEFWTSKKCPGGCGSSMIDVDGEYRVRQCTTASSGDGDGIQCSLSDGGVPFRCDRDMSSTVHFCSIPGRL
ncbi:unnamed protein product [Laminaria digitata]